MHSVSSRFAADFNLRQSQLQISRQTPSPTRSRPMRGWRNGSNLRLPPKSVNNEMCSALIVSHLKSPSPRALIFRPRHTVLRISRNRMEKSARAASGDDGGLRSSAGNDVPFPERFRAGKGNGRVPACERAPQCSRRIPARNQGTSPATVGRNARRFAGKARLAVSARRRRPKRL
jgi:hypothetical protein